MGNALHRVKRRILREHRCQARGMRNLLGLRFGGPTVKKKRQAARFHGGVSVVRALLMLKDLACAFNERCHDDPPTISSLFILSHVAMPYSPSGGEQSVLASEVIVETD
jgi:hypothetical protein